nr:hypothetical protein VW1_00074 [Enterobacter sp.]
MFPAFAYKNVCQRIPERGQDNFTVIQHFAYLRVITYQIFANLIPPICEESSKRTLLAGGP